jgi:hypothetical protein
MLANDDLQGTETIIPRLAKVSPKRRKQFKRNRRHTVCAVVFADLCAYCWDNRLMTIKGSESPYFRKYSSDLAAHLAIFSQICGHCQPAE